MDGVSLAEVQHWDKTDPLRDRRDLFALPDGVIYLDGNSLGPLPHAARDRVAHVVSEEWGRGLIRSWDEAGWMASPVRVGAKIAGLIGAAPDEVIVADSTSVILFKLAAAAIAARPGRTKLVTEAGNFPTDRHVLDGISALIPGVRVECVPEEELGAALDEDTALLLLCHVHYRSGARHDMAALSAAARRCGAMSLWDLSHSVGAVPIDVAACGADMAAGCGYKFLNGGPGAPAFAYVARREHAALRTPIQGWIGHAEPFGFSDRYVPAPGMGRLLSGTPGVLGLAALEAGVDVVLDTDRASLWAKSRRLFDLFAQLAAAKCPWLSLMTPADPARRGSHISFQSANAAATMRALIARGIIGDFRPPDVLRFGLTPLYMRYEDVWRTVDALRVLGAA